MAIVRTSLHLGMILLTYSRYATAFTPLRIVRSSSISTIFRKATESATTETVSDTEFDASLNTKVAFMFPGQGAQFVGMCANVVQEVPKAKELFDFMGKHINYDSNLVSEEEVDITIINLIQISMICS